MSKFEYDTMLPSQAKKALTSHFLERLEQSGLDFYADPKYRLADALGEFRSEGDWVNSVLPECFEEAKKEFERKHPKCWDHEKPWREGICRT